MKAKKSSQRNVRNPLEAVGGFGNDIKDSLINDLAIKGAGDFMDFLGLGTTSEGSNSESSNNSPEIDIVNFKKSEKSEARPEAAIDYSRDILRGSEQISHKEAQVLRNQIEQIKAELISLAQSTKVLQVEVASVTVEQTPENTGTYHANFFEWMLNMIKAARERVETSEAWMSAHKSKNGKKGYWDMFKKHGTSFALSSEQSVATQVG